MTSPKPARGWNATSHEALLLALIDEIKPSKAVITQVTTRMKDAGYTYSYDAIKLFRRLPDEVAQTLTSWF